MVPIKQYGRLIILSVVGLVLFFFINGVLSVDDSGNSSLETVEAIEKTEAQDAALSFVQAKFGPGPWQAFVLYDADADASGYLTKEQQFSSYNASWADAAPLEYWRVEVRDEAKANIYHVLVELDEPAVFGFKRMKGLNLHKDAWSLEQAEQVLGSMGYDLSAFTMKDSQEGLRFVHRDKIGDAALYLHVETNEGEIIAIYPQIEPPSTFTDWKAEQDAKGAVTSIFSLLLWLGLALAAVVLMAVYRSEMSFSRGIWLSLGFLIPYLIYTVNMYPGIKLTTASMDGTAIFGIAFQQFINMLLAVSVYVSLVAGEGLWRKAGFDLWPHHRETRFRGIVMRGVGLGYLFCFMVVGLQAIIFYVGGLWFDVWFGIDPMLSSYNLLWPSTYPLLAWSAAISEEAVFRLFAIILFAYAIRPIWRWIARLTGKPGFLHPLYYLIPAIVVTSVIWALAHMSYSVYPVYTRLVEVAILGLVFSFILIKYGLIAAIFAHATVDLMLMGLEILSTGDEYVLAGLFYMLMPLLVGLFIRFFVPPHKPKPPATADGSPPSLL